VFLTASATTHALYVLASQQTRTSAHDSYAAVDGGDRIYFSN